MARQLRHKEIEAFAAVMRTGSVVAAATQLRASQPNISRVIHDLEAELGYRLFQKRGRGLEPTGAARALYAEVERSFLGLGRIAAVARQLQTGQKGSITFGTNYGASFELVHAALGELKQQLPGVSVSLRVQTSATLIDWARTGFVDLALVNLFSEFADIDIVAERELECVCVLPTGHPLLGMVGAIELNQLLDETLIIPDEVTLTTLVPDFQTRTKIIDRGWLDVQIWYPVAGAVEHGLGIGIADPLSAAFFARNGKIAFRPLSPKLPYRLALVQRPGSQQSDFVAVLAEIIAGTLKSL